MDSLCDIYGPFQMFGDIWAISTDSDVNFYCPKWDYPFHMYGKHIAACRLGGDPPKYSIMLRIDLDHFMFSSLAREVQLSVTVFGYRLVGQSN